MSTDSPTLDPPTGAALGRFFDRHWRAIVKTRTPDIEAYLSAERDILAGWLERRPARFVVEAGCADGELLLPVVLRRPGVGYLGVDLAADAVAATRAALHEHPGRYADAVRGDIADLPDLVRGRPLPDTGLLTVFGFNVLGELRSPTAALRATARCGSDVAIFTYTLSARARRVREDYYRRCGFDGGWDEHDIDGQGLAYRTADGFFSTVYPRHRIRGWLADHGYVLESTTAFTPFAVAYRARLADPARR